MKQVLIKSGQITVEETPAPAPAPGRLLVRVHRSLISSGTEAGALGGGGPLSFLMKQAKNPLNVQKLKRKLATVGAKATYDLVKGRVSQYQTPGYSTSGVIISVGEGVPGFNPGDRVACAGMFHACHAAYNLVPHQLVTPIPEGVSFDEAAYVAVGAIALQGVRRVQPTLGETIVVTGLGLIGLLTVQILAAAGCHVIGCDPQENRRILALSLGAEAVADPENLPELTRNHSAGWGADAVIVCAATASSAVLNQATDLCRQKGRVVVVGAVGMDLQREPMYLKEIDLHLSCSYGPGRYDSAYEEKGVDYPFGYVRWTEGRNMAEFLRLIASRKIELAPLEAPVFAVDQAAEAYDAVMKKGAITALIDYGAGASESPPESYSLTIRKASEVSGKIGIALIGAGAFATSMHLPNIAGLTDQCALIAIANRNGIKARQAAERFGAAYCTTDYHEILEDKRVDAIIIATRHHLHAPIALEAIAAGKHVYIEKPMCMTGAEGEAIRAAAAEKNVLVSVGFNRRFAPMAIRLKEAFAQKGPRVMIYRCNAGSLPPDHWTLDPVEGGGRILGEAVHFLDFLCWLTDAAPIAVHGEKLTSHRNPDRPADNAAISMRFADGSIGTILYTAIGHPDMPKERLEVFAGGQCAVLDDFQSLTLYGPNGGAAKGRQDKGGAAALSHFIDAVHGKTALSVTAEDGLRATRLALAVIAGGEIGETS